MGLHIEAGMEHQQCQSLFCNVHLKILCAINRHVSSLLLKAITGKMTAPNNTKQHQGNQTVDLGLPSSN